MTEEEKNKEARRYLEAVELATESNRIIKEHMGLDEITVEATDKND